MARTTLKIAAERRSLILAAALTDREPLKAIAADLGLSLHYIRTVIWAAGYRCMQVSPEERAHILARRQSQQQQHAA